MCRPSLEARTTSRPLGEMDKAPTGCSSLKEASWPKVSLSKAEDGPRWGIVGSNAITQEAAASQDVMIGVSVQKTMERCNVLNVDGKEEAS